MSVAQSGLVLAGEMFVASAIVLALAFEAAQMCAGRAALRHLVWVCALATLIALPLLAVGVPSQIHVLLPAAPMAEATPAVNTVPVASVAGDRATVPAAAPSVATLPSLHLDIQKIALAVFALWLAGVIVLGLRGAAALIGLRALKRQSRPHMFANGELIVGPRYEIRIARAPNGYGPITWGLVRPVILLPFHAQFWTRERLQAVLLHETAHIARRDSLSQLLATIACALYWPSPLVWMAARALRNEAEIAADDMVIASGMRPSSYAGELLQLASEFRSRQPALAGMPLFMAAPSALEARVKSVLASNPSRSGVTSMDVLKIGSAALLATAMLMFARPSFAQDEPPAPPAPPAVASAPLPPPPAESADVPPLPPVSQLADAPPPPAAPADLPAPAALPAPATLPAPAALPAPVADADPMHANIRVEETDHNVHGHREHRMRVYVDGRELTAEEVERMRPKLEKAQAIAREAQARAEIELRKVRPQLEQAEIRAHEADIREIEIRMPEIKARMQAELAKVQPEIDRAIAEARLNHMDLKIQQKMDKAMKHMEVRIEMRKARDAAHDTAQDTGPETPDAN